MPNTLRPYDSPSFTHSYQADEEKGVPNIFVMSFYHVKSDI